VSCRCACRISTAPGRPVVRRSPAPLAPPPPPPCERARTRTIAARNVITTRCVGYLSPPSPSRAQSVFERCALLAVAATTPRAQRDDRVDKSAAVSRPQHCVDANVRTSAWRPAIPSRRARRGRNSQHLPTSPAPCASPHACGIGPARVATRRRAIPSRPPTTTRLDRSAPRACRRARRPINSFRYSGLPPLAASSVVHTQGVGRRLLPFCAHDHADGALGSRAPDSARRRLRANGQSVRCPSGLPALAASATSARAPARQPPSRA